MRLSRDEYFLWMAHLAAMRSTCVRRKVGCVLVDNKHRAHIGYNGPPSGFAHCTDTHCPGAGLPSGTGLEKCEAIHAEQNALIRCGNPYILVTAYVTASPCIHCIKILLNTSCQRIVFSDEYPHTEAKNLWVRPCRIWQKLKLPASLILTSV